MLLLKFCSVGMLQHGKYLRIIWTAQKNGVTWKVFASRGHLSDNKRQLPQAALGFTLVLSSRWKKIQSMSNSFLFSLCCASFLMRLSQDFGQLLHKKRLFPPLSPDPHFLHWNMVIVFCLQSPLLSTSKDHYKKQFFLLLLFIFYYYLKTFPSYRTCCSLYLPE